MNSIYEIFNYPYIQQQAQKHHFDQINEVQKSAKALKDFLDGIKKFEPAYQKMASEVFCSIILDYISKNTK